MLTCAMLTCAMLACAMLACAMLTCAMHSDGSGSLSYGLVSLWFPLLYSRCCKPTPFPTSVRLGYCSSNTCSLTVSHALGTH
jgi:hypothetical protein